MVVLGRIGSSRDFKEKVCDSCGESDWEGHEKIWRVNGQEGNAPEPLILLACSCGATYTFPVEG